MSKPLMIPSTVADGVLYRVTYTGRTPREEWTYRYELEATPHGYEVLLHVSAACSAELRVLRREGLPGLLAQTTTAMHDVLAAVCDWHPGLAPNDSSVVRRCTITTLDREPFGAVATRIMDQLPRLLRLAITAYYR